MEVWFPVSFQQEPESAGAAVWPGPRVYPNVTRRVYEKEILLNGTSSGGAKTVVNIETKFLKYN